MPRGSSDSTTSTVNTNTDPWAPQQPYLKAGFDQASQLYESPFPQFYGNSTVVPHSAATTQALGMQENRALQGSPLLKAGQGEMQKTLGGDYLNAGNPAMGGVMQRLDHSIRPQVQSVFANAGGSGGSFGEQDAYTRAMADAAAPYQFSAYENERGRMGGAALAAPGMAAADYADIGQLGQVGAAREELGGRVLQDDIARHDFAQNLPQRKLQNYQAAISGNLGGATSQQTTQPLFRNPVAGGLGGAATGAGLGLALQQLNLLGPAGSSNAFLWPLIAGGAALGGFGS